MFKAHNLHTVQDLRVLIDECWSILCHKGDMKTISLMKLHIFKNYKQKYALDYTQDITLLSEDTIKIKVDDKMYKADRWCPHKGHDLLNGSIIVENGVPFVQCPKHKWQFNLENGVCLGKSCQLKNFGILNW